MNNGLGNLTTTGSASPAAHSRNVLGGTLMMRAASALR
jgi:hypothetical protein